MARRCRARRIPCLGLGGMVARTAALREMFAQLGGLTDLTRPNEAKRRPAFWLAKLAEKTAANLVCKPPLRR
jgi:hypothetical protein